MVVMRLLYSVPRTVHLTDPVAEWDALCGNHQPGELLVEAGPHGPPALLPEHALCTKCVRVLDGLGGGGLSSIGDSGPVR